MTVRAGNWLHKGEPLALQDSQASVADIQIGARLLIRSRKRRNLTARVGSIWPVCFAALTHVADTPLFLCVPKTGFHNSHNNRSGPMKIKRFKEQVIGSDLVPTEHDDLVNFTWRKRNVAKPYQPEPTFVIMWNSRGSSRERVSSDPSRRTKGREGWRWTEDQQMHPKNQCIITLIHSYMFRCLRGAIFRELSRHWATIQQAHT
jgi:hypothetical protein